jgi:hypothetical protein
MPDLDPAVHYEPPTKDVLFTGLKRLDRPGEHLWTMIATWHIGNPEDAYREDTIKIMDRENLLMFSGPGCFKCEKQYSNAMAKRTCQGSIYD